MIYVLILKLYAVLGIPPIDNIPYPLSLVSSNSTSLTVSWPVYPGGVSYTLNYTLGSSAVTLSPTSSLSSTIPCIQGSYFSITYKSNLASSTSAYSYPVTFFCSSPPDLLVWYSLYLSNLTLYWKTADPYVLGFYIWEYTNSLQLLAVLPPTVRSYSTLGSTGIYTVGAYNFASFTNQTINLTLEPLPDFSSSIVQIPTAILSQKTFSVYTLIYDTNGNIFNKPVIALLEIRNPCYVYSGYECINSNSTSIYNNILPNYTHVVMSGTGNLTASYLFELPGNYSISVLSLQSGVLAQYWNNMWFYGTFETKVHTNIEFYWNGYITQYAFEFVSAKYFFFLTPRYSENYTIFIDGDDSFVLYVDGVLIINSWNACCQEVSGNIYLTANSFYYVQIQYRQLTGSARLVLSWSSRSQPKQVVPGSCMYWPTRLNAPVVQSVTQGASKASLCYYSGIGTVKAGYMQTMYFYSVDANSSPINIPSDIYSIKFGSNLYYTSQYISNGISYLNFTLSVSGNYTVSVTLYNTPIKNSPFNLTVIPGDLSPSYTLLTLQTGNYIVGSFINVAIVPKDAFGNLLSVSTNISMSLALVSTVTSSLPVSPPSAWMNTYGGSVINYYDLYISFMVYVAGNYSVVFKVNSLLFSGYPVYIYVNTQQVMVEHTYLIYNSSVVTPGSVFMIKGQLRDQFYNNFTSPLSLNASFTSSYGNIGQVNIYNGVVTGNITLTVPGVNNLTLIINNTSIIVIT